nr:tetratricopeptide repeat protein [Pirellula staleyi]
MTTQRALLKSREIRVKGIAMLVRSSRRLLNPWLLTMLLAIPSFSILAGDDKPALPAATPAASEDKISELIRLLGSEEFAERERAQTELSRLGLEAFDALHQAQYNEDVEISLRARYLIRAMNVQWFEEEDPVEVVRILKGYGEKSDIDRRSLMDQLTQLPPDQVLGPLCRLVRFETDNVLSKYAALKVLNLPVPQDDAAKQKVINTLNDTVGPSKRTAAGWIRTFAKSITAPEETIDTWTAHALAEHETLTHFPERTSREIVRDLYRWEVELLRKFNREEEMLAVIRRTIPLIEGAPDQLQEVVDWLAERNASTIVREIAAKFPQPFTTNPSLMYRMAEIELKSGNKQQAEEIADKALAIRPESLPDHLRVGYLLQERGLREWSEREYRSVMKNATAGTQYDIQARFFLSEMLHDFTEELEAANTLQGVCDLADKDPAVRDMMGRLRRNKPNGVYARMHYFYARHWNGAGDVAKEREALLKAVEYDDTDADVLIALFRLKEASDMVRTLTREKIETAAKGFRDDWQELRQAAEQAPNEQFRREYDEQIATACNQLAWLVSNTFGDFDEALAASKRSLELVPESAGYLDTLGRCYFAKKDLKMAIETQRRAVKLEPNSRQLKRQLDEFEKALAAQGAMP